MSRIQLSQPSFANGYARSRGESVAPELWPDHAWVPAFGPTGATLFDLCGGKHGLLINTPTWQLNNWLKFDGGNGSDKDRVDFNSTITLSNSGWSLFFDVDLTGNTTLTYYLTGGSSGTLSEILFWQGSRLRVKANNTVFDFTSLSTHNIPRKYCIVSDGTNLIIYYNGVAVGSTIFGEYSFTINRIGATPDAYNYATFGMLKNLYAYNTSLNQNDILALSQDLFLPFRRRVPVFYSVPSAGGGSYSLTLDGSSYAISGTASQLLKLSVCSATTASYEKLGTTASLLRLLKIIGVSESYAVTGTELSFLRSLNLSGLSGSYEVQGIANSLLRQLVLSAGLMSYALSGTDAALSAVGDSSLVVDSGDYEISGTVATLLRTFLLTAITSSYTKSGTTVTLLRTLSLGAAGSDYALTGTAADLVAPPGSYILDASWSGAQYWRDTEGNPILDTEGNLILIYDDLYKIIPKAAELLRSYPLSANTESYSVNGTASDLLKLAKLISNSGAYNYSGKSIFGGYQKLFAAAGTTYEQSGTGVDLSRTCNLAALTGSYSLFGTEVRFIPTIFMVGSGSYNLLGMQISTILSHVLPGTGGEYVLTGTDNLLYYGFFITPQSGSYLSAGVDADLRMFSGLSSYGGSYLVSGNVSDLKFLHKLDLGSSQYDITGTDPDVLAVRALTLGSNSYTITGEDVVFDAFYLSMLGGGSYLLNGVPITFGSDYILYARPGIINYSGQITLLWYSAEIIGNVLMFLDIKTAEIILAVKSPQLTLEFNERN